MQRQLIKVHRFSGQKAENLKFHCFTTIPGAGKLALIPIGALGGTRVSFSPNWIDHHKWGALMLQNSVKQSQICSRN